MQSEDETTFRPSDVARELNVTTNTVRNWTKRYNEFLSDGTRPEGRDERAFSRRDLAVLHYINDHVNDGYTHDYIAKRLPETTFSDDEVILPPDSPSESSETLQERRREEITPASALDTPALAPLLQAVQTNAAAAEQIHALQEEQNRQRDEQRTDMNQIRLLLFALLVVMVLVLVAVVMLVVVMR